VPEGVFLGWTEGFEPSISRATTWRLRPLGDAHHEKNALRFRDTSMPDHRAPYHRFFVVLTKCSTGAMRHQ
jgi:hypothetical protein